MPSFLARDTVALLPDTITVVHVVDRDTHHEVTIRAADERAAEREIDRALRSQSVPSKVWRGARLMSVPTIGSLSALTAWTYSCILTDRREQQQ